MPGICGIISANNQECPEALKGALASLSHRGNGSDAIWHQGSFSLGITGGKVLEKGDSRLILDSPKPVDGFPNFETYPSPYAYAILNRDSLTLGRDALGMRPLFWTFQNGFFIFASELKGLIASNLFTLRPDLESLSFYLSLGYFPVNRTPFKDVYKVRPGHKLTFTLPNEILVRPTFSFSQLMQVDDPDWNQSHYDALAQGVIDSYEIKKDQCSTLEFEAADCPNLYSPYSQLAIPPIAFDEIAQQLPQIVWHLDEPLASSKILSFWRLCAQAKAEGKSDILLSAGSLNWLSRHIHRPVLYGEGLSKLATAALRRILTSPLLKPWRSKSYFDLLRSLHTHPWHRATIRNQFMLSSHAIKRLTGGLLKGLDPEIVYHSFPPFERIGVNYSSLLYLHQKTSLIHSYMAQYDKIPTAFGLTAHTPYCERGPLEYLASITEGQLEGLFRRISTPAFEKALFAKTTLIDAHKARQILTLLLKGVCVENGLIDPNILKRSLSGDLNNPKHFRPLWAILILEVWLRLFFENPLSSKPPQMTLKELLT